MIIKLEGAELAEQFRAIANELMVMARSVSNIGKPEEDNNFGREAVRLRVAATEIDRLVSRLGERELAVDSLTELARDYKEQIDQANTATAAARFMYDQEYEIVARIWKLYGEPSYDDLKGRSIYDLVKESIDRAQSAESRLGQYDQWFRDNAVQLASHRIGGYSFHSDNGAVMLRAPEIVVERQEIKSGG